MQKNKATKLDRRIGFYIRLRRHNLGLTASDLAQRLGISFQQVVKYERGKNRISFSRLVDIAHALGCSVHDLISDLDYAPSNSDAMDYTGILSLRGATDLLTAYVKMSPNDRGVLKCIAKALANQGKP